MLIMKCLTSLQYSFYHIIWFKYNSATVQMNPQTTHLVTYSLTSLCRFLSNREQAFHTLWESGPMTFLEVILTSHLVICSWANGRLTRPDTLALASECLIASGPWGHLENTRWSQFVTCRTHFISPIRGSSQCTCTGIKKGTGWEGYIYIKK